LVNQKKIEIELLALLKWSHEESLKTQEEYQKREKSYDQALIAYQKRIADMLKDTRLQDLESANAEYRRLLAEAQERLRLYESQYDSSEEDASAALKARALEARREAEYGINELENPQGGRP
ncbi:MAG: hypothetical protein LBN21_07700, partial [Treponema sp.]|nr:hypothetical protein [Treponema sp.]